ncbi:hypothetical protein AVEN_179217-1 [Araneus ventricosus]|uniref:DUF5641 domain-containing protein n=1 Tax=Araneus ventricosus TaxID=182803 RepID=A0A4Y2C8P2_ARAVE|nr:hypothetical protein AVEN_179217-1 [Araneus ventricosus]
METVLCDCENQLNSRLLTYVSDDPDDLYPLTPDLFLKIHWSLGRILSIYASKDGIVRRAKIKTKSGIVIRPIRKLRPLELDGESLITNEDEVADTPGATERQEVPESNTVTTRAGRQTRPPSRYRPLC